MVNVNKEESFGFRVCHYVAVQRALRCPDCKFIKCVFDILAETLDVCVDYYSVLNAFKLLFFLKFQKTLCFVVIVQFFVFRLLLFSVS